VPESTSCLERSNFRGYDEVYLAKDVDMIPRLAPGAWLEAKGGCSVLALRVSREVNAMEPSSASLVLLIWWFGVRPSQPSSPAHVTPGSGSKTSPGGSELEPREVLSMPWCMRLSSAVNLLERKRLAGREAASAS
jgi:hypothetical protein